MARNVRAVSESAAEVEALPSSETSSTESHQLRSSAPPKAEVWSEASTASPCSDGHRGSGVQAKAMDSLGPEKFSAAPRPGCYDRTRPRSKVDTLRLRLLEIPGLIPVSLLFAAILTSYFPERGLSVLLGLAALGMLGLTQEVVVVQIVQFAERVAKEAARSGELQRVALHLMRDPEVMEGIENASKRIVQEMLLDEVVEASVVRCMTEALGRTTFNMTKDVTMQKNINVALRSGVQEAMADETLIRTFMRVLRDGLRDPNLHAAAIRGGIRGTIAAANPLRRTTTPKKEQLPYSRSFPLTFEAELLQPSGASSVCTAIPLTRLESFLDSKLEAPGATPKVIATCSMPSITSKDEI